jgi:hypothetical protein
VSLIGRGGGGAAQLLTMDDEAQEDGAAFDVAASSRGKCAVIKTSTRQTIFLPVIGLVPVEKLKPNDLIGVNKDSFLILDTLPPEYGALLLRCLTRGQIRFASQGDGGGRAADGAVQRRRRAGQSDPGAGGGGGAAHPAQGAFRHNRYQAAEGCVRVPPLLAPHSRCSPTQACCCMARRAPARR